MIEAHEKDLRQVFGVLDKHSMVCKPTKASLLVREVEFAGHVVQTGNADRYPENWQHYATAKKPKP